MLRPVSTIDFIGGEKGGVGKSVVARLVAQYCIDRAIPFAGVDADSSHGTLRRHYADHARAVDLARLESADEIIALATDADRRVVVDLPAQSERLLLSWLTEANVVDLARECGIELVFWHVIDDGKDSISTLDRLIHRLGPSVRYRVVENLGRGKDFSVFHQSPTHAAALALGALVIELPELLPAAMQKIDRTDASFWAAAHNPLFGAETFSRMDRQRIKVWLQTAMDRLTPAFTP
jgi:hypothetical protein